MFTPLRRPALFTRALWWMPMGTQDNDNIPVFRCRYVSVHAARRQVNACAVLQQASIGQRKVLFNLRANAVKPERPAATASFKNLIITLLQESHSVLSRVIHHLRSGSSTGKHALSTQGFSDRSTTCIISKSDLGGRESPFDSDASTRARYALCLVGLYLRRSLFSDCMQVTVCATSPARPHETERPPTIGTARRGPNTT
ncbi:hypothetical protein DENSPDRAFT_349672 [Dentipellis sp. KUC8613]|nr:hypothetical protein DENSPDRAFT_349672 [Dentipellis sp. KUC8613]